MNQSHSFFFYATGARHSARGQAVRHQADCRVADCRAAANVPGRVPARAVPAFHAAVGCAYSRAPSSQTARCLHAALHRNRLDQHPNK